LRQLVQAAAPQEVAYPVHPWVAFQLEVGIPVSAGDRINLENPSQPAIAVGLHRAEFVTLEALAILTDPGMGEEHWPPLEDPQDRGDTRHHRRQQDERHQGDHLVEDQLAKRDAGADSRLGRGSLKGKPVHRTGRVCFGFVGQTKYRTPLASAPFCKWLRVSRRQFAIMFTL
jgi:hypothetical protein